ncbi:hypothetical protein Bca4012_056138 [Brassica carinata]|uniref:Uncharacterized protein n=1 Tax=Brassica carinata TaxID=52824 RepID=A0A8X7VZ67_BRACI|nr:hypothetical protein Bca52824_014036 [Brassica carinata]
MLMVAMIHVLLTLAGLRWRGVTLTAINAFVCGLGITRRYGFKCTNVVFDDDNQTIREIHAAYALEKVTKPKVFFFNHHYNLCNSIVSYPSVRGCGIFPSRRTHKG